MCGLRNGTAFKCRPAERRSDKSDGRQIRTNYKSKCMIRNFFKIAFRNITRHKGFSFINIAGLTLGLTACLLIGLFVWDENQYDKFLPGGDRVYRV